MKTLLVLAMATCCFGQQEKPAKTATTGNLFSCLPNDCATFVYASPAHWVVYASPAHWDEAVKDGTYTFSLTDPNNKWRCYFTSNSGEQAPIVCVKPHDVVIDGGK